MIKHSEEAKNAINDEFGHFGARAKQMKDVGIWNDLLDRVEELSEESFTVGQKSMKRRGKPDIDQDKAILALYDAVKPTVKGKKLILDCNLTDFRIMLCELLDNVYPHLRYLPDPIKLADEMEKEFEKLGLKAEPPSTKIPSLPTRAMLIAVACNLANIHAEKSLQAVFDMSDEEYEKLQTNIRELVHPLKEGNLEKIKRRRKELEELGKSNHVLGVDDVPGPHTDDPWKQRSKYMVCGSCMNYQAKGFDTFGRQIGACKDTSPSIKGFPRAFFDEKGCGAHKLAVVDKPK